MKFVNMTPHAITIVGEDGLVKLVIPPSGKVARVRTEQTIVGSINTISIVKTELGDVEGVPTVCSNCHFDSADCVYKPRGLGACEDQEPAEIYVVSSLVAQALKGRKDVVAPDTSPQGVVRDENGRIVGVKRFQRW
jgi:hypothetical protein